MSTRLEESDLELDALLGELSEDDRALLLEEHRQLEKDLLRLSDPLPPADFVTLVMKREANAPARAVSKAEMFTAAGIVLAAVSAAVVALLTAGSGSGGFGLALADLAIRVRDGLVAMGSGLVAIWTTAALPLAVSLLVTVGLSLVALKRFSQPTAAKVTT
jgi:hypothetical protein